MPKYGDPTAPIHVGTSKNILSVEFPMAVTQSAAKKRAALGDEMPQAAERAVGLQNVVTSILAAIAATTPSAKPLLFLQLGSASCLLMGHRRRKEQNEIVPAAPSMPPPAGTWNSNECDDRPGGRTKR